MDSSFTVKLKGCKDYMLAVNFKRAKGSNLIFSHLWSIAVVFFGRKIRIGPNDQALLSKAKLWECLTSRKEGRQVQVFSQSNVPFSVIEKNSGFGRRAHFTMDGGRCLSLAEGNIIDILKNTKKDLTNNQLIVPGPEKLQSGIFYKNTALHVLNEELKKITGKDGKPFNLQNAMNHLSKTDNSDVVNVPIPVPNDLNLKNIVIVGTPKNCDGNELSQIYEKAIAHASLIGDVKASAPPYNACFLIPMGTGNVGHQVASEVCANSVTYLSSIGAPATVVCYDNKTESVEKLFDKIQTAVKTKIDSEKEFPNEGDQKYDDKINVEEIIELDDSVTTNEKKTTYVPNSSEDEGDANNVEDNQGARMQPELQKSEDYDYAANQKNAFDYLNKDQNSGQRQARGRAVRRIVDSNSDDYYDKVNITKKTVESDNYKGYDANFKDIEKRVKVKILEVNDASENFAPIYNRQNSCDGLVMASVNAGDSKGYVGGLGVNGGFRDILEASVKNHDILYYEKFHSDLVASEDNGADAFEFTDQPHHKNLCRAAILHDHLAEDQSTVVGDDHTGTVIIDVFKDDSLPYGNTENRAMTYIYPPNIKDFTNQKTGLIDSDGFLGAVKKTAVNLIVATEKFNENVDKGMKIQAVRVSFFSSGLFSGHILDVVVHKAIHEGIVEGLKQTAKMNQGAIEMIQYPVGMEETMKVCGL